MPIDSDQLAADVVTVLKKTVTLTDAQIKALMITPVELVSAPGAGKAIFPLYAVFAADFTGGPYTNVEVSEGTGGGLGVNGKFPMDNKFRNDIFLDDAGVWNFYLTLAAQADGDYWSLASVENEPLVVAVNNASSGFFTGGHADNTLKVTVLYTIIDV